MQTVFLSEKQLADVFQIGEHTIAALVQSGLIPHTRNSVTNTVQFSAPIIADWLRQGPVLLPEISAPPVDYLRRQYLSLYPEAVRTLLDLDKQITPPRQAKYYYLSKVPSRKLGFVYYVRYLENGRLVPSRWSARTNNYELAKKFAEDNRDRILSAYHARRSIQENFYGVIERYYEEDSQYLKDDLLMGRTLCEHNRKRALRDAKDDFAPFLKRNNVQGFSGATPAILVKYQKYLRSKGLSPKTVNQRMGTLSAMFNQFVLLELVPANPFREVKRLKVTEDTVNARGCHDIEKTLGVFDEPWADQTDFLLCLLIYSTGLRNSELRRATVGDVFLRDGLRFLSIKKSKTKNGARVVPLHPFVCSKLDLDRPPEAPLAPIPSNPGGHFISANRTLGYKLGMTPEQLEAEHITFYSGRHFYKTMLNDGGLGDAEEYFMGHKTSSDVEQTYNHRDRQGQKKIAETAEKVFKILDNRLFGG
jgi:integrase